MPHRTRVQRRWPSRDLILDEILGALQLKRWVAGAPKQHEWRDERFSLDNLRFQFACELRLFGPVTDDHGGAQGPAESVRVIWLGRDGLLEASQRLFAALEFMQHGAAAVVRLSIIGIDCQRPVVARQRLLVALKVEKDIASVDERVTVIRFQCQRPVVANERFSWPVELRQRRASPIKRLDIARVERQCLIEACGGFVSAIEAQQCEAEIQQSAGRVWIDAQGTRDQIGAFRVMALLNFDRAEKLERVELLRRDGKYLPV